MRKRLSVLLLLSSGTLAVLGCDGGSIDLSEHKIKPGGKPGLSFAACKDTAASAQAFFGDQSTGSEREVFATELQLQMAAAQPTVIVDVRPVSEYSAGHIPTSVNIPLDVLFEQGLCSTGHSKQCDDGDDQDNDHDDAMCKPLVLPIDGTPIVLVSSNGHAAALAAGVLGTMGYNVFSLRFGMIAWAKSTDVQVQRPDKTQRLQGLGGQLDL
jgi:rhodanese-related sulfurtransferase